MLDLIGKIVEVNTVDTVYTGKLVEINENEAYLESASGWITIPVDRIAVIREIEEE
ncbi:MAG: hypothetical protein VST72_01145 [Nitrospirota bacterium]|nr:hypothetical protein [Nitrospirota bacterium]